MVKLIRSNIFDLPVKLSLNYWWCCGFMLRIFMVIQIISGIVLSFFYNTTKSFEMVMRFTEQDFVRWLIRYMHVWGARFIFLLVYAHIGRRIYYGSYRRVGAWNVGFMLYLFLMIEAFIGYILPWHQMSFWAATVLTSLITSIPYIGPIVYSYVVGGYSVTASETLVRFFPLHVVLGIRLIGVMFVHLYYLHRAGSTSPMSIEHRYSDCLYFHGYYSVKDLLLLTVLFLSFFFCLIWCPNIVLDVEAFICAKPLVTPPHIKPEWYFLAFYAMLRCINSKVGGIIFVVLFLFLIWVPVTNCSSSTMQIVRQHLFWFICSLYVVLSYIGGCGAEYPYVGFSKVVSLFLMFSLLLYKVFDCFILLDPAEEELW